MALIKRYKLCMCNPIKRLPLSYKFCPYCGNSFNIRPNWYSTHYIEYVNYKKNSIRRSHETEDSILS